MANTLRSATSRHGRLMAGARALWKANGMTDAQMSRPLIAIANSLIIVALLSSVLLMSLSSQRNEAGNKDAQQQQEIIVDAILGFAMSAGRLPCPADPTQATTAGAGNEEMLCNPVDCSTSDRI